MGLLRLNPPSEMWASKIYYSAVRNAAIRQLAKRGEIVPVEIEGMKGHATPEFLSLLDLDPLFPMNGGERTLRFIAPLDQFVWDRKMTAHLFGFDYVWEIYVPEAKRRWGYYVLPALYGDDLVARVEFRVRSGVLEIRRWHREDGQLAAGFVDAFEVALREFRNYCAANELMCDPSGMPKFVIWRNEQVHDRLEHARPTPQTRTVKKWPYTLGKCCASY